MTTEGSIRPTSPAASPAVELRSITVAFGGLLALDGIDLMVEPGERLAVLGPNGAGKTTLFNVIAGDVHPTHGTVIVQRPRLHALAVPTETLARRGTHVPEDPVVRWSQRARTTSIWRRPASSAATCRCAGPHATRHCATPLATSPNGCGSAVTSTRRSPTSRTGSAGNSRSAWRSPPIQRSCCSTNRHPACRGVSGSGWSNCSPRLPSTLDLAAHRTRHGRRLERGRARRGDGRRRDGGERDTR